MATEATSLPAAPFITYEMLPPRLLRDELFLSRDAISTLFPSGEKINQLPPTEAIPTEIRSLIDSTYRHFRNKEARFIKFTLDGESATLPFFEDKKPGDLYDMKGNSRPFFVSLSDEKSVLLIQNIILDETARKIVGYIHLLSSTYQYRRVSPSQSALHECIMRCIQEKQTELLLGRNFEGHFPISSNRKANFVPKDFHSPEAQRTPLSRKEPRILCSELKFLPREIGNLIDLKRLDLSHMHLGRSSFSPHPLPESISLLKNLTHLILRGNIFLELPSEIGGLSTLILLDLTDSRYLQHLNFTVIKKDQSGKNPETTEPAQLLDLIPLQYLSIQNTKIELPDRQPRFTRLRGLNLTNTKLKELPRWIGDLPNLRELYLGHTNLLTLLRTHPFELSALDKLTHFDAKSNFFKSFSRFFGANDFFIRSLLFAQGYKTLLTRLELPTEKDETHRETSALSPQVSKEQLQTLQDTHKENASDVQRAKKSTSSSRTKRRRKEERKKERLKAKAKDQGTDSQPTRPETS